MSKRSWLLGVGSLILVALLLACGSKYNASSNGLLLVGSRGSAVIETFSFSLNNGHVSAIANSPSSTSGQACILNGLPASMVIDPAGAFAYVALNESTTCSGSATGIQAFKINSDGTITAAGSLISDPNPIALSMDAAGKFLFVAEGTNSLSTAPNAAPCPGTTAQYGICVYAIAGGGALTGVPGNFTLPTTLLAPDFVAVAATPTVFPGIGINGVQNAVCSTPGNSPPTSEFVYAVDGVNNLVWEFSVDTSTGALGNPPGMSAAGSVPTAAVPAGVAIDPCDRFAYVSNGPPTNKISAYQICVDIVSPGPCPNADGSLVAVSGSPFSLSGNANQPGPLVVDPFGNNVYVVGISSNTVSGFKISPTTGGLTALNPPTVATGQRPTSIAIRGDDNWMFVSNFDVATVSQYSVTPATGALNAESPIATDNNPSGIAVK
jgi:6-phosphogluconolactonase (cycloisomerase 2 family)